MGSSFDAIRRISNTSTASTLTGYQPLTRQDLQCLPYCNSPQSVLGTELLDAGYVATGRPLTAKNPTPQYARQLCI